MIWTLAGILFGLMALTIIVLWQEAAKQDGEIRELLEKLGSHDDY